MCLLNIQEAKLVFGSTQNVYMDGPKINLDEFDFSSGSMRFDRVKVLEL